jgi:hypothetical protein
MPDDDTAPRWPEPPPGDRALRRLADLAGPLGWPAEALAMLRRHRGRYGRWPRLAGDMTYTEAMARRILFDRNPLLRVASDRIAVRELVRRRLGADIGPPFLAVCDRPEELPWDDLPDGFVIKPTHGSGMNVVVRDKARADRPGIAARLRAALAVDYHSYSREWGYRGVPRRLVVEPLLRHPTLDAPPDWKFFCFGGEPRLIMLVVTGAGWRRGAALFLPDGRPLAGRMRTPEHALDLTPQALPEGDLAALCDTARRLAQGFDHIRVDLLWHEGRPVFGELTAYTLAGLIPFQPPALEAWAGALWTAARRGLPAPPLPDGLTADAAPP